MADITAEQVARAIEAHDRDQGGIADALGGWHWEEQAPDYVREGWRGTKRAGFRAALTRWHAELVAADAPRVLQPWTRVDCDRCGCSHMASRTEPRTVAHGVELLCGECQAYAAALSAAEAERAAVQPGLASIPASEAPAVFAAIDERMERFGKIYDAMDPDDPDRAIRAAEALDPLDTSGPIAIVAGDGMRLAVNGIVLHDRSSYVAQPGDRVSAVWAPEKPAPAPMVVDVPQPEPWHARLVRLASDVAAAAKAHEDAQAEREAAERRESEAWTALRNARGALHDATEVSAILAAQQPTLVEPTRPEPRFKVGDWVRVQHHGTVYQIGEVADPFGLGTLYFREKPGPDCTGQSWAAVALNPALDPALHETARATILLLGDEDARPLSGYAFNKLPGAGEWQSGKLSSADWAVQLERLLGDAS